ncbi:MAG: AMP-binding protein, partial [Gammaproteobacteria bacterium]|nr:AMP-binding protein [Gammaproteobacteria bacterium]
MNSTRKPDQTYTGNLFSTLRKRFPSNLDSVFLRTYDKQSYSYTDMIDASGRIAQMLIENSVQPGDRVAMYVEKSPQALFLYLAALRAGGVFLPLNTAYTASELRYFLEDAQPSVLVCSPEQQESLSEIAANAGVRHLFTLDANGAGTLTDNSENVVPIKEDVALQGDDIAAILYTSGTTGRSKGAMLTHDNLASNALALTSTWHFTSNDCLLHALPIFHTHGLFVANNVILACAGSMIFLPKFDTDRIIESLPNATTMMGVPTFYMRLLTRKDFTRELVSHIRLFVSGSAPLSAETHKQFKQHTDHAILERYGMTETSMNTSNPYNGERRAGTVGFPL